MRGSSATINSLDMREGGRHLEMHVELDGAGGETIFFRSDRAKLAASREAAATLLMLWAMRQGQGLKVEGQSVDSSSRTWRQYRISTLPGIAACRRFPSARQCQCLYQQAAIG